MTAQTHHVTFEYWPAGHTVSCACGWAWETPLTEAEIFFIASSHHHEVAERRADELAGGAK